MGFFDNLFGRNRRRRIELEAPKTLNHVDFQDVEGNRFKLNAPDDYNIFDRSELSSNTQRNVSEASRGISQVLRELSEASAASRTRETETRQLRIFSPLRNEINASTDAQMAQVRSNAARRFGGSLNSTFSASALGEVAKARLSALESAYNSSYNSALNELSSLDEARALRFNVLSNYLNTLQARKDRYTLAGFDAIRASKLSKQQTLQGMQASLQREGFRVGEIDLGSELSQAISLVGSVKGLNFLL